MPIPETLRSILEAPLAYLTWQSVVGGIRARRICIRDYVPVVPGMVVIDIGCGPGYPSQWLRGADYYGFDICAPYIDYARRRFGKHANFVCAPFTEAAAAEVPQADVVLLMGLLHHLDDADTVSLLRLVKSALRPGGRVITLDGCYRSGQSAIARYFLDSDRGRHIRKPEEYRGIASSVFPRVAADIREDLFYIPYTCMVLTCQA